jgi:hypothetical protein
MIFADKLRAFAESLLKRQLPVVDLTFMPPNPKKVYGPRDDSTVNLVVVHCTAVKGGFGVASSRAAYWESLLEDGTVNPHLSRQLKPFERGHHARLLALWERYAALPYHWIGARAGGGQAVHNFLPSMKTIHGHAGNRGIGWALDCDHDEPLSPELIEAGRVSLTRAIQEVRSLHDGTVFVAPHRAFSNTRLNDPGAIVWNEVVIPVLKQISYACVRLDHCEGTGLPIPNTWDPNAKFDAKGKLA